MSKHPIRLSFRDVVRDVVIEMTSQLGKTALLIAAVALSVGALLASFGISRNAAYQIDADLAASTIRHVTVEASETELSERASNSGKEIVTDVAADAETGDAFFFPADTQQRLESLNVVQDAGIVLNVSDLVTLDVARPQVAIDPSHAPSAQTIHAVSSGYLEASGIAPAGGNPLFLDTELNIAFLTPKAAQELGVPTTANTADISISVDGKSYSVAGFLAQNSRIDDGIVIPFQTGTRIAGSNVTASVLIEAKMGAGNVVSRWAAVAILPQSPESLSVSQVVSAESTRGNVSVQLTRQAMWVGAFLVVLASLLVANSMIVSVTARTTEIGVRRALGSSKSSVAAVFWAEGALIGFLGGLTGSAVTVWVVLGAALVNQWTARLDPLWIVFGPALGTLVGLVASAYPSFRAARIHPAIAVRSN